MLPPVPAASARADSVPAGVDPAISAAAPSLSPPTPAKPILASTLLENLLRQHRRHNHSNGNRVRSSFGELDDYVLQGGVERGVVVGVSGDETDGVGRLVSLHLLTTALLSNPHAKASIIDTTGSFSLSFLARIIRQRTASHLGQNNQAGEWLEKRPELDQKVEEILGRVAISRVFDIEGVWEVLSEISADCQPPISSRHASNPATKEVAQSELVSSPKIGVSGCTTTTGPVPDEVESEKEPEIVDSETEEDYFEFDDRPEEVDDLAPDTTNVLHSTSISLAHEVGPNLKEKPPESMGRTEIVIIDNMTTPINELFSRRERNFAHTLLTAFTRRLCAISQSHNILTILLNTLTKPPSAGPHHKSSIRNPSVSVFSSTTARPALGRLFADIIALHLLVTTVPRTAKDTDRLYASPQSPRTPPEDPVPPRETQPAINYAYIIEVLKDKTPDIDFWLSVDPRNNVRDGEESKRHKHKPNRSQRWAAFDISAEGLALKSPFGPETEDGKPMSASGQTHIAKQFPFGRRV